VTREPITHSDFSIERIYDASPERVFAAWSTIEIKQRWFIGPAEWSQIRRELVLETGGREILRGRFTNGRETSYEAHFYEVIQNERIVYAYDMHLTGVHHSVSLATVEFEPAGAGTRLVYTEQTAWLDGTSATEGAASRQKGVGWHLDNLGGVLAGREARPWT
jgi:uncharacterized protein YndB with AHSA1/START domain